MNNLRVLMFGWEFPPFNSGGLGVACQGLSTALGKEGIQVTFVLPQSSATPDIENIRFRYGDECADNITFRRINSWLLPYDSESSFKDRMANHDSGLTLYEAVFQYAEQAAIIAEQEEFDVIHAHDWLSFGAGVAAKYTSGKPLVVHVHATEHDRTGGHGNPLIRKLEEQGLQEADHVITVSNLTKQTVIDEYSIPEPKISAVHNGIDKFQTPDIKLVNKLNNLKKSGQDIVLFLGRITIQKGPDYFVEAAEKVLSVRPNTLFIMAGSGDMQNDIMQKAAAAGLGDQMLFPGFVRGAELHALYAAADLYVMPSVSEPFGLVALEALSKGTPVLISKQSGVSEVISHALKADFWDTSDIADKIIMALDDKTLSTQLSNSGAAEVKNVTWKKAAKACKKIYGKVLSKFSKKGKKPPK